MCLSTISLFFLLLRLCPLAEALLNHMCEDSNFSASSTYQSNLKRLLSNLTLNGSSSGFLDDTEGSVPDQVYGLLLCRGDVNTTECQSCLDTAILDAQQLCAYYKGAAVWYDFCFLRFSNQRSILSDTSSSSQLLMWNSNNATQLDRFNSLLGLLLNSIADLAANSSRRFATAEVSNYTSEIPTIYGLMQCMPYMSVSECSQCLRGMFEPPSDYLKGKQGGRILGLTCTMRYEAYSFYQGTPTKKITAPPPSENAAEPATAPAPPPVAVIPDVPGEDGGKKNVTGIVLAVAITAGTIIFLSISVCICYLRRKSTPPRDKTKPKNTTNFESIQFDLSTLRVATANFAEMNKLGEGGFGAVYKGRLPNGQEIAVKKLLNFRQGLGELKNELVLVAKLQHRNLVRLLGVCSEEKMIVYEYVPNRSLDTLLFDHLRSRELHWRTRYKIICGIARGLLYLHEESQLRIIHRDLKPNNILLDSFMNPKISDFGLAKLFDGDQSQGTTRRIMGTFGYMAPEYAMQGIFSIKSDVFSFGVVVLEILTGRRITADYDSEIGEDILTYAWGNWNRGTTMEIIDPALNGQYQAGDVLKCIQIGLLCVQENPLERPTMRMVDLMLNSESTTIQRPSKPAFCVGMSGLAHNSHSNNSNAQVVEQERGVSNNEASISELEAR